MEDQAPTWYAPLIGRKVADIKKSYSWQEKADLKNTTEALIVAS